MKRIVEELNRMGVTTSAKELRRLALVESTVGVQGPIRPVDAIGADSRPPIDAELLDRLESIDYEAMSDAEIKDFLDEFGEQEIDESDEELVDRVKSLIQEVKAIRIKRRVAGGSAKKMTAVCPPGYIKDSKGKCVREKAGARAKRKRKAAKWARSGAGKMSAQRSDRRAARFEERVGDLASRLRAANVGTSRSVEYAEAVDRVDRILGMLSEMYDDERVTRALAESWENLSSAICEGESDELDSLRPVLNVIKTCLEDIEGN